MPGRFEWPVRMASGFVLGAIMVLSLVFGGIVFSLVVSVAAIAALREWHRLINAGQLAFETIPTSIAMIAISLYALPTARIDMALAAILTGGAAAAVIFALRKRAATWPIPWHAFGAFYVGMTVLTLVLLRGQPHGSLYIGALFTAVWTADTGALLAGRLLGGPKLAPWLSPNKTWTGFMGGAVAAGAAEAIFCLFFEGSVLGGLALGILLAVVGHAGDLFESWVKRQFHAKNTGSLIPGHGGMLDRIDSLLFAAPVMAGLVLMGFSPFSETPL
jgi:phosphatidate cytidylyltransferase